MLRFVTILLLVAWPSAAHAQENVAAAPMVSPPPAYPSACAPEDGAETKPERVTVRYGVTRRGQTVDVKIASSSNACFNDISIATVRGWVFKPRRFDGRAVTQPENEVVFSFVWQDATQLSVVDAQPIKRVPPRYPQKCMSRASSRELVVVLYDVTATGMTENVQVSHSTNECLNKATVEAVAQWRYNPKYIDRVAVRRPQVETVITFQLSGNARSKEEYVRRKVRSRLKSVERALKKDPQEALEFLAEIEAEYAESFSRAELGLFHQMRGAARIKTSDYRGALDDLRITQRNSFYEEQFEAVYDAIAELEAAIALQ